MGSASRIVLRENRTGEVVQFVADILAARGCLGYGPQTGIQEGIRKAIAWYSGLDPIAVPQGQRQRSSSLRTCGHGESVRTALRKDAVQDADIHGRVGLPMPLAADFTKKTACRPADRVYN
jgi:hypothetical protein